MLAIENPRANARATHRAAERRQQVAVGVSPWKGVAPRRAAKAATAKGRKREAPETGSPETKEIRIFHERDTKNDEGPLRR